MTHDWYKDFFHGLAVDLWVAAVPEELTAKQVEGLLQLLELPARARVLDMPCGSGRHSIGIAKAGHHVTGVDISPEFLDVARRSAAQAGVSIELLQADMNEVTLTGQFDAAICLGNSFGYFDQARTAGFVRRVADALKPGGRFILDCGALAETIMPNFKPELQYEFGEIRMQIRNQYCTRNSRLETHYTFTRGNEVQQCAQWHWVYTTGQVCRMLEDAGLEVVGLYRSLDREPLQLGDQYAFVMSQKPASG